MSRALCHLDDGPNAAVSYRRRLFARVTFAETIFQAETAFLAAVDLGWGAIGNIGKAR